MDLGLERQRAIVTGASRGIGRAIALELAREGMAVGLTARDQAALDATAAAIRDLGAPDPVVVPADLMQPDAAERIVKTAVDALGGLDLLVNNAGATKRGDFMELDEADHMDGFALKYHGARRMCRHAWPHLKARGGRIVNIVGAGARTPSAEFTVGGPVNSALLNFTKALADLGLRDGVRVNAINPGPIETDRLTVRIVRTAEARGVDEDAARRIMLEEAGLQRFGRPEEIGRLVAFLASAQAGFIHGATVDIDGGVTRGI
ncbi:MAG TPA: SDR family oxidoreductase [Geminicoccaceae bacterium]